MGLFAKIFGTKESTDKVEINEKSNSIKAVMEHLRNKTGRDSLHMELNTRPVGIFDSKVGGTPYISRNGVVPLDADGNQLRLLAQIRLADLPANEIGLPVDGMLQFWALDDDLTGLETDAEKMLESKGHAVVYYDSLDDSVTKADIENKYHPYCEGGESYFPVQDEFGITFKLEKEGITTSDYQFDEKFAEAWNEACPENRIGGYFELDDDAAAEYIYNDACGSGHKLGGYPMFTQYDPREGDFESYQILLLQIDSFGAGGKEIMWGDAGVGSFFITPEDLRKRDFSKVLYTWDCC